MLTEWSVKELRSERYISKCLNGCHLIEALLDCCGPKKVHIRFWSGFEQ